MEPSFYYFLGALVSGLPAGAAFVPLWQWLSPKGTTGAMLSRMLDHAKDLFSAEQLAEFGRVYKELAITLGVYLARTLGGLALGCLPVVLILVLAAPAVLHAWDERFDAVLIHPRPIPELAGDVQATARDKVPRAYCWDATGCLLLALSGLPADTRELPAPPSEGYAIIRVDHGDSNPLWPFLGDLEATFFAGVILGSTTLLLLQSLRDRRAAASAGSSLAPDYPLVVLSSQLAPLLEGAGNLESRLLRAKLDAIPIDRPIFVTGLARSGTTTVLNLLSRAEGVASHRYRDFPFLFFPVAWSWFQDRMSSEQTPVERPHKDRIFITKESADAFEEPLWQHFFPAVHSARERHVLERTARSEAFERVFPDHLRKILMLRRGDRYVSKGNYNVTRIAYLARLFPDARFIVPIREPLSHVHSLVKQHRRFTEYAKTDPRVPRYLEIAGHYEFGPQRRPINVYGDVARIEEAFARGDDYAGYAMLWADVYRYVAELVEREELAGRVMVLRYESLCASPVERITEILRFTGLEERGRRVLEKPDIEGAPDERHKLPPEARARVEELTREVARRFGYE